jgi:hypothetical protein
VSIPWPLWVGSVPSSESVVDDELLAKADISASVVDAELSVDPLLVRAASSGSVVDEELPVEEVSPSAASKVDSEDWSVLELAPPPWW